MEKQLKKLCETHNLRTMSVMYQHHLPYASKTTVYLHYGDQETGNCESGSGKTFTAAFTNALNAVEAVRR